MAPHVSAWFFKRDRAALSVAPVVDAKTLTRLERRIGSARNAGLIRRVQPQGGGSGATVRARLRCFQPRVPVETTGTVAPTAVLRVAT